MLSKASNRNFLNRIDEIIVFHPLYKEDMKAILDIMLRSVTSRVMENMELKLKVTDEAQEYLIDKGFDEKYGCDVRLEELSRHTLRIQWQRKS